MSTVKSSCNEDITIGTGPWINGRSPNAMILIRWITVWMCAFIQEKWEHKWWHSGK